MVDLNRREFPSGDYDWVTFLGVLEYIHEPRWPLEQAAKVDAAAKAGNPLGPLAGVPIGIKDVLEAIVTRYGA